jgi:hypothetical protein
VTLATHEMVPILAATVVPPLLLALLVCRYANRPEPVLRPLDEVRVERYASLRWLLKDARLRLLRSRGAREREKRIRLRRYRIVSGRLQSLKQDFAQVCASIKRLMVHSPNDRPDLASHLFRAQLEFAFQMLVLRLRLLRYR